VKPGYHLLASRQQKQRSHCNFLRGHAKRAQTNILLLVAVASGYNARTMLVASRARSTQSNRGANARNDEMFYRILRAPPGYPAHQKLTVAAYRTLEDTSADGSGRFFSTFEEARAAIPGAARRLEFEPAYQFLELWESSEPDG
jgi:hypothetical protein